MEQGSGSVPVDKNRVLDVKPLRILAPIFPNQGGKAPASAQFACVPPTGPFPAGVQPFYPFLVPNGSQRPAFGPQNQPSNSDFDANDIPAPVPLNSYRTPMPRSNGKTGKRGRPRKSPATHASEPVVMEDDEYTGDQNDHEDGVYDEAGGSNSTGRRGRPREQRAEVDFDLDGLVNSFLTPFKLHELDEARRTNGDRDTTGAVLLVYNLLRRKLTQLEEARAIPAGIARRPDLKTANLMMTKGIRTNNGKRTGHLPGIEIGDMFYFRMELCLLGLHAPSMAGIDYGVVSAMNDDPVALSIVSSGGYGDDSDDSNVLVYSGQGGVQRRDGLMFDQKLERGNLALEKSVHRGNEVRVIRGVKDADTAGGKIYFYDGLYKIESSWTEKNKSGCAVFKYKLVRLPGQPEAFSLWKSIQQWKDGTITRDGLILPDLTSGMESVPVTLVNDVDGERGPSHFTYMSSLNYTTPFSSSKPSLGCQCTGGCQVGNTNCHCNQRNDGLMPYSSLGILMCTKPPIYECGKSCACSLTCRNRVSQWGTRVHLEVFKTTNKGWGLRSLDPIRAGSFICEYAGDVIKGNGAQERDDNYIFDATRYYETLDAVRDDSPDSKVSPFPLVISAKNRGNVARFMNHSCSPNVFWQPVLQESNGDAYLRVAFFAIRHIPPMQELTYNYGKTGPQNKQKGKKCFCESAKCRGFF